jgi:hypothetical protein
VAWGDEAACYGVAATGIKRYWQDCTHCNLIPSRQGSPKMTLPSCWKQGFSIVKTSNEQNERSLHKAKLRKCPQLEIERDPLLCHPGDLSEMTDFTLKSLSKDTKSRPQRLHDEAILHDKTAGAHEIEHAAPPIPGFSG